MVWRDYSTLDKVIETPKVFSKLSMNSSYLSCSSSWLILSYLLGMVSDYVRIEL